MNRYDDRPRDPHRLRDLRDGRRAAAPAAGSKRGLVAKVFWIVVVVGVAGFAVSRFAARPAEPQPLPKKQPLAGLKAKDLQQQATEWGIEGGAVAGKKAVANDKRINAGDASPEPEVVQTANGFVVKGVRSENPYVLPQDRKKAIADALAVARHTLIEKGYVPAGNWSFTFDPDSDKDRPKVHDIPPTEDVRKKWEESRLGTDRGWVEIDELTLTHDTLRQERAKGRTAETGFWFGTLFLGLLAVYGFLRLDMWTKGYLTLVLGLVVGAVLVAAILGLGAVAFAPPAPVNP